MAMLMQGKYKMTMGLEPMDPMDWIEIDQFYDEEMALRRQLVKEKRDIVIHSTPEVSQSIDTVYLVERQLGC
jgi:hypothetical protein